LNGLGLTSKDGCTFTEDQTCGLFGGKPKNYEGCEQTKFCKALEDSFTLNSCSDDKDCELLMSKSPEGTNLKFLEISKVCCSAIIDAMKSDCDDMTVSPDELVSP